MEIIKDAYRFLIENYQLDDELFFWVQSRRIHGTRHGRFNWQRRRKSCRRSRSFFEQQESGGI